VTLRGLRWPPPGPSVRRGLRILVLFALPVPLLANTGIPMVFMTIPFMMLALIPVILVETLVVWRITGATLRKALSVMTAANIITTVVGLPLANLLTWFMALCAGPFTVHIRNTADMPHRMLLKATLMNWYYCDNYWVIGPNGRVVRPLLHEVVWYMPLALAVAFLVNLLVSHWLEYRYMCTELEAPRPLLRRASFRANVCSYFVLVLGALLLALTRK